MTNICSHLFNTTNNSKSLFALFFHNSLVIDALKEVDGDRKCFRLVGGVLVERTVKEVLPALQSNYEQVPRTKSCVQTMSDTYLRRLK